MISFFRRRVRRKNTLRGASVAGAIGHEAQSEANLPCRKRRQPFSTKQRSEAAGPAPLLLSPLLRPPGEVVLRHGPVAVRPVQRRLLIPQPPAAAAGQGQCQDEGRQQRRQPPPSTPVHCALSSRVDVSPHRPRGRTGPRAVGEKQKRRAGSGPTRRKERTLLMRHRYGEKTANPPLA